MERKTLHPSVQQFKEFLQNHPHLIKMVRKGEYTWQELYEDWYLLGDDDPKWSAPKDADTGKTSKSENNKISLSQITNIFKSIDINQVQNHIQQLSQAIGAIQGVLSQFQSTSQQEQGPQPPPHPFSFRKD